MAKSTELVQMAIDGLLDYEHLDDASKSYIRMPIYRYARNVIKLDKEGRKQAINKAPECLRKMIVAECRRLLDYRRH